MGDIGKVCPVASVNESGEESGAVITAVTIVKWAYRLKPRFFAWCAISESSAFRYDRGNFQSAFWASLLNLTCSQAAL